MSLHLDQRHLYDLLDGVQNPAAREHLDGCPHCQQALARLGALQQALRQGATPVPSKATSQAMRMALDRALDTGHTEPERSFGWLWVACAVPAVTAALVLFVQSVQRPDPPPQGTLAAVVAPATSTVVAHEPPAVVSPRDLAPAPSQSTSTRASAASRAAVAAKYAAVPASLPSHGGIAEGSVAVANLAGEAELLELAYAAEPVAAANHAPFPEPLGATQLLAQAESTLNQLASTPDLTHAAELMGNLKQLMALMPRIVEPHAMLVRAEQIARLVVTAPLDEEAAFLACESGLATRIYPSAYRLCTGYLDRFPRGSRAREVAYLTATVARVRLGDCQAAIRHYSQALLFSGMLQSYNDSAYLGRALCYEQLGNQRAAASDLDVYLFKRPGRADDAVVQGLGQRLGRLPTTHR